MFRRLFQLAALLLLCTEASGESEPAKVQALAGETVVLPCQTNADDLPAIEWSKEGLAPKRIILAYRNGRDVHGEKNELFHYRTSLIMDKLKDGNISLRISGVQLPDAGKYTCKTIRNQVAKEVMVQLSVDAVSEPKLSAVPAVDGGVTLQCEADCWCPQPEITFLDKHGNVISAEEPRTHPDNRGCFNVTRRMTLQTYTSSVTCRVHQPKTNQTRVAEIYIPDDCMRSCTRTAVIAVAVAIAILLVILFACVAITNRKCGITVGGQKSRQSLSTTSRNVDIYPRGTATTDLLRKLDELELNPHEKEDIVRKLTQHLSYLVSERSAVVPNSLRRSSPVTPPPVNPTSNIPHSDNPKPAASTGSHRPKSVSFAQNVDLKPGVSDPASSPHNPSSPALPADTSAVLPPSFSSDGTSIKRTMSLPASQLRLKPVTKLQRRYTMMPSNRFSPLEGLSDDEQALL
ncbi:butyrophilin subfamily 3 member A2-like isoform X2 [Acanthopagrus latus]|uniref:butyrophilin subfamily 3 member A2-like isoform X2 n=1 Tax=Acanthopagrus latus TaxID=8177 RepID=UPI00187CAB88|nr:butyrophilin subfamily 3 member A2-like isoform X2 [Acanthopagrus latus]